MLGDGGATRPYTRHFSLGKYQVEVELDILPPSLRGRGGLNNEPYLILRINGVTTFDRVPFGYHVTLLTKNITQPAKMAEWQLNKVVLYADGDMDIQAQYETHGMNRSAKLDLREYASFKGDGVNQTLTNDGVYELIFGRTSEKQ